MEIDEDEEQETDEFLPKTTVLLDFMKNGLQSENA